MSPPTSHSMLLPPGVRPPTTPSNIPGSGNSGSNSHQGSPATNSMSQHKRSQSFNHHLSYNQYTPTQPPPHHLHPPQPPSLPSHLGPVVPRLSSAQTPSSKTAAPVTGSSMDASPAAAALQAAAAAAAAQGGPSARKGSTKGEYLRRTLTHTDWSVILS